MAFLQHTITQYRVIYKKRQVINDFIREAIGLFALDEIDELKQLVESTERMIIIKDINNA